MDKLPLITLVAFKNIEGYEENHYVTLLDDHLEGEGDDDPLVDCTNED